MDLYTLDQDFAKVELIDFLSSAIWTERVSGNGDFQLVVPATPGNIELLSPDTYMTLDDSDAVMMIETQNIKNKILTVNGISLEQELNNRFIRFTADHNDKSYLIVGSPGYIMQFLVQSMCIGSDWLSGVKGIGIANPLRLTIPYLTVESYDDSLPSITTAVSYGPLYDALKNIADTYQVSQRIYRAGPNDLRYENYLGEDHTSMGLQTNLLVRFTSDFGNFTNPTEVETITNYKTHAFAFASGLPAGGNHTAGEEEVDSSLSGFQLRAMLVFADDVTSSINPAQLTNVLNQRAEAALIANSSVGAIDGEVINSRYVYGVHYRLGDIVETQGSSGAIRASRVTEYIRSRDASGEKAYPTLVAV